MVVTPFPPTAPPLPPFNDDDDEEDDEDEVLSFLARRSAHTNLSKAVHCANASKRRVIGPVMPHIRSVNTVLQGQGQA